MRQPLFRHILAFTVLFCLCLICSALQAQNVSKIEYYLDTDPGFGKGTNVPITASQDVTASLSIDINSLTLGFHNVYVRSLVAPYLVQENGNPVTKGGWSLTNVRTFYKENFAFGATALPNIVKGEYFIDTDPGFGKGINIPVSSSSNLNNINLAIDVTALPLGFHNLFVRFRDSNGNWSLSPVRSFYKQTIQPPTNTLPNIVKGEYFVDTDPGFGKGVAISVTPGTDLSSATVTFDITSLSNGFHQLYARFRDANGNWSITQKRTFYKENLAVDPTALSTVVKGEYYIDTDPGFGNGTAIPVSPASNLNNVSLTVDITALTTGFHNLYVRFRDSNGNWSHTPTRTFYKEAIQFTSTALPNIVKGEYFIDADPGLDKATSIAFTAGTDLPNITFAVNITSLSTGFHQLYTRFKDAKGNWGLTQKRTFYKENLAVNPASLPKIVKGEYFFDTDPGFGLGTAIAITSGSNLSNVSFVCDIISLPDGFHQLYTRFKDDNGQWSLTNTRAFYKQPTTATSEPLSPITQVEYFIDTDPGFGKGRPVSVTPTVDLNNVVFEIDITSLSLGDHILFLRAKNEKGTWSITNKNKFRIEPPSGLFITVGQIDQILCIGSPLAVPFTTNGPFSAGNIFTAQLSDVNGSFTSPRSLGTLAGTGSGTINVTVPNATSGSNYRIRVVASTPQRVSLANNSPLSINSVPPVFAITGDTVTCPGTKMYNLSNYEPGAGKYIWMLSSGGSITVNGVTATVNWTVPGNHSIKVKYTGACAGLDSVKVLSVNVIDNNLTGTFSGMLPADGNANLSLPITFSWLPITNATSYDLYIWPATENRPTTPIVSNLASINYTVYSSTILQYEKTYKWQLVAKRACYDLSSPVQTFRLRYLPDVIVSSVTPAASGFSGQSFSINWQVKNVGLGGTLQEQWTDDVYLSTDAVLDLATDIHLGTMPNPSELQPNASYSQTGTFTLPQGISNNYYVFVITNVYRTLHESDQTNNTTISTATAAIQLTPPPDLQVTSIVPPNFVFSGQNMTLNWKVSNLGTGSTRASTWTDDIYLSKEPTLNLSNATYLGNSSHTGALEVGTNYTATKTVKLPDGAFGKYYLYVRTDVGNTVYEHASENNNVSRSDTVNIILTPPIDLAVTQLTVTPLVVSNRQTISIQWKVENAGGSSTENRTWSDYVYLSKDSTFKYGSSINVAAVSRPNSLNPGDSYTLQQDITVPSNLTGNYFVYVLTDGGKQVYEYDLEDNNIGRSTSALTITTPDLIVSNIVIPAQDTSGRQIEIKWDVKNNSNATLVNTSLTDRISLSPNAVYSSNSATELKLITYTTGDLTPGATLNKSTLVTLPDKLAGDFYIYVQTDYTNTVYEAGKDTNNTTRSALPIKIHLKTWPDLQVSNIQTSIDSTLAGAVIPVTFKIVNKGDGPISGMSWTDKLYISAEAQFDVSKAVFIKEFLQSRTLPKDSAYTVNTSVAIPAQISDGIYYLYVVTDANGNIGENANETNNTGKSKSLFVKRYPPVDLAVASVTSVTSTGTGNTITVAWSIKNIGVSATLQTQWNDALYLSRDTVWTKEDDVIVKEYVHNGALAVNQSYSNQQTAYLPDGISGVFYVLVVADHTDFNKDSNRRNNYRLVTQGNGGDPLKVEIKYSPPSDLRITSFVVPSQGQAGQPITVKWKVKNTGQGTTASKSWTDRIYLSTSPTIDNASIVLGSYARSDSLKSGQEYSDSLQVVIPSSVQGSYYTLIKTDANSNVYEYLAEDNNTASSVITIAKAPISDLIVSDIIIPNSAVVGEDVTIQWKIKNIGAFPANGYMKNAIYLSEDAIRDVNDILLATKDVSISIDPQGEIAQSFTGELRGAALKNYHAIIYTDVLNNIYESDDSNNNLASAGKIDVTVPELPINVLTKRTLSNSKEIYYRIDVPNGLAGETLLITLKGDSIHGANEIYVRFNQVPTRALYDYSYNLPYAGNQEIVIPALKAGTYYLLISGLTSVGNYQEISLLAKQLNFEIRSVNANKGGNTGSVTVLIGGSKLGDVNNISLRSGNTTIQASSIKIVDPTKIYATFDLRNSLIGRYDVVATNSGGNSATFNKGFEIVGGTAVNLVTNVVTPPSTRPSTVISLTVEYTNSGNTDLVNPILKLSSLGGAPIGFNVADLTNNTKDLTLALQELNGPDNILRPGASGTIIVYSKAVTALGFLLLQSNN